MIVPFDGRDKVRSETLMPERICPTWRDAHAGPIHTQETPDDLNRYTAHLPPLGSHQREEVGQQLQATLVELVDLSLLGKQLHWTVVGRLFRPLHLHLDEVVDSWRELSDTVAERDELADHVVVRELTHRLAEVAERARERMDRLGELDAPSQNVLIEVVRALEDQLWMIRAQFSERGER